MSASTVPAVRLKLVELLRTALTEAEDTVVSYGHPGKNMPRRLVAICDTAEGGATRAQHTMPLRRTGSRTEDYLLRVVIWVATGDATSDAQQRVTSEAWALADLLDDLLRTDPTLGGLVDWALPSRFDDLDGLLAEGRAAEVEVSVSVHVTRS